MTGRKNKILIGAYTLLAGAVLLYILFPSAEVKQYIVHRLQQEAPTIKISIDDLKLSFPPGLSMNDVVLSNNERDLFFWDRIKVFPKWLSLFTSEKAIGFRGRAYLGKISGSASPTRSKGVDHWDITGVFSDLRLEQIPVLQEEIDFGIVGLLSGNIHIDADTSNPASGSADIVVSDCTVLPEKPIMNIDRLSFQQVEAAFDFDGSKLNLKKGDIQGTELNASVSGSIFLKSPANRSTVDMDIVVTPHDALLSELDGEMLSGFFSSAGKNDFNFRVTGSLDNPQIAFGLAR